MYELNHWFLNIFVLKTCLVCNNSHPGITYFSVRGGFIKIYYQDGKLLICTLEFWLKK